METVDIRVRRMRDNELELPSYAFPRTTSGLDLRADLSDPTQPLGGRFLGRILMNGFPGKYWIIPPHSRVRIPTGFAFEIPQGYEGQMRPRSGLSFDKGLTLINAPGTVDSDYRGELRMLLINLSSVPIEIAHGDRLAQLIIAPVVYGNLVEVKELSITPRGNGGYGSTGVK